MTQAGLRSTGGDGGRRPAPRLVSVDLETSGTLLPASPIIAIGACVVDRDYAAEWDRCGRVVREAKACAERGTAYADDAVFYAELRPPEGRPWVASSVRFHRLRRADLDARGLPPATALQAFLDWLAPLAAGGPARLVSHNAAFDWAHLTSHLLHHDLPNPFDPFPACTKNMARGRFAAELAVKGDAVSGQTSLAARLDLPRHLGKHNALADALSQAVLYRRLTMTA